MEISVFAWTEMWTEVWAGKRRFTEPRGREREKEIEVEKEMTTLIPTVELTKADVIEIF